MYQNLANVCSCGCDSCRSPEHRVISRGRKMRDIATEQQSTCNCTSENGPQSRMPCHTSIVYGEKSPVNGDVRFWCTEVLTALQCIFRHLRSTRPQMPQNALIFSFSRIQISFCCLRESLVLILSGYFDDSRSRFEIFGACSWLVESTRPLVSQ